MATIDDFLNLDIRTGQIIHAEINSKARNPAYILQIDFGDGIGIKGSSAQICENYDVSELIGKKILAIVNFPPRKVAGFKSEVLVLAVVCKNHGTVLITPDKSVNIGEKLA